MIKVLSIFVRVFQNFPLEGEDSILAMTMKEFAGHIDEVCKQPWRQSTWVNVSTSCGSNHAFWVADLQAQG